MVKHLQKSFSIIISWMVHFFALYIIYSFLAPIASWYLTKIPIRGTDIHLSAIYVNYILKWGEFLRPAGWKYVWFSGQPLYLDYPSLYFFAMALMVKSFGLIGAVMNFAVIGLFVFSFSCYFLFFELSKSRILALLLTIASIASVNVYLSLVWAGGIPFWTTQAFFPLVTFLVVKFLNSKSYKWLFVASLVAGIGILGHPQGFLIAIFPFCALILLFYKQPSFFAGLKNLVIFLTLSFLVAFPGVPWGILFTMFSGFLNVIKLIFRLAGFGQAAAEAGGAVATQGDSFPLVYLGSLQFIWFALFAFILVWTVLMSIEKSRRRKIFNIFPFVFFLVFYLLLLFLFSKGIDFFFGGWYKALWVVPVILSSAAAVFWSESAQALGKLPKRFLKYKKLIVPIEICLIGVTYFLISPNMVKRHIESIDAASIVSKTHPDFLSERISSSQRAALADEVVPPTIDGSDKNKRVYAVDATFNMWWNSLFDMPLARGYIDPPITNDQRWGLFWMDSALGPSSKGPDASLMVDWKVPEEILFENYKFLLDWNAIGYLAGNWNHVVDNSLAKQATSDLIVEKVEQVKWPREQWAPEIEGTNPLAQFQMMNFYKVKPQLVSPILAPNNAASALLIGDNSAYDTVYRFLGMRNLNSQKVVVAWKSQFIDSHSLGELKKFSAIILYRYNYRNGSRSWDLIKKYLQEGGKVYIDTGGEVRESESSNLPDYFPFSKSVRSDIGKGWDVSDIDTKIAGGVQTSKFSPLVYDGGPWNVSYPKGDLRENVKTILKNNGKVVAAQNSVGSGKIVWTGFNLPYHAIYNNNPDEAKFLENVLSEIIDLSPKDPGQYSINWISPEKREISYSGALAILFKEQAFPSWEARAEKGNKLAIYRVGPTSPGYIYVPLDPGSKSGKVTLSYYGKFIWWVYWAVSIISVLVILEMVIFGKSLSTTPIKLPWKFLRRKTSGWWEREE